MDLHKSGFNDVKNKIGDFASKFSKEVLGFDPSEVKDRFATPYVERYLQAIKTPGIWVGPEVESPCRPDVTTDRGKEVADALSRYGVDSIPYKDAYPDFSKVSVCTAQIDTMSEKGWKNRIPGYKAMAEVWNREKHGGKDDWTWRDIEQYKKDNNLDFHECQDRHTVQLVPACIHEYFKHCGGIKETQCANGYDPFGGQS